MKLSDFNEYETESPSLHRTFIPNYTKYKIYINIVIYKLRISNNIFNHFTNTHFHDSYFR